MILVLSLSAVIRPNNPTDEKLTTYESGVDPVELDGARLYIRYYVFGLLFVIFDVEAVLFFLGQ